MMSDLSIIILCGGFGTRIKPAIDSLPKILAPIKDSSFFNYLINWLNQSFNKLDYELILSLGYRSDQIKIYSSSLAYDFIYSCEEKQQGTLVASALAASKSSSRDLLIINGDTLFEYDLLKGYNLFKEDSSPYLFVKEKNSEQQDLLGYDFNNLTGKLDLSESNSKFISLGALFINKEELMPYSRLHQKTLECPKMLDHDFLSYKKPRPIILPKDSIFIDIGTPPEYIRAQELLPEIFPLTKIVNE